MGQPLACLVALCLALASAGGSEPQGEGRARNHGHNVCSTWGDFHYKTFDGDVFRFPGLCDYNLASDCRDAYKEFAVHLKRGPGLDGGHPQVEYILLTIKDDTIYLTHQLVVVNGAMVSTPHYRSGLLIEKSDAYTKVFSRAGLTLMWNREDALMLELDSRFRNHTCGLCGDYNGLQTYSEFLSDGVTFSAIEFGNMQKINKPETVCDDPEEVSAPKSCSEHRAECERLLKAAAFTECLGLVPLEPYVQTCAQDRCQCPPGASCVCSTLAEFSRQCSHAGGRPGNWRTASLCPKTCPGNMVYLESGSPCMDTCSHLEVSHLCEEHRMDGCFCPEGTVYDDIKGSGCVPVSQCHCQLHGHLYAPGQQVRHDCEQCVCNAGRWTCQDLPCPGTCALEGGSHITTFDGKKYTFHGDCYYVLAKGDHGDSYALLGELGPCGATDKQTCLKTVVLLADKEKNVVVFKSEGSVLLNELQVNLPHVTASFSIFQPSSYHLVVSTSFGLRLQIQLEPVMQLFLTLDQEAQGRVQGLCGNFNGQEGDDFKTAGGLVEATGASFANTWKAQSSCQDKLDWLDDPCYLNIESANYAEHWCSLLKNRETPFGRCHSAVDPAEYYKRCKYDTCNCQNNEDCMCAALSSYARACAARGVMLWGWRDLVCNKDVGSCPRSQVFLYNLTTCQQTCRSLSEADSHCLQGFTPVDGCGCPDHTFLDEKGRCVPLAKCSCYHRGLYVEAGDVVLRQEERCVCRNGRLHCNQVKLLSQSCRAPKIHIDCNNLTALAIRNPRPLSCQTLAAGQYQTECVSGCVCPEGLLDDGRGGCVREHECPCVHNQDLYAPGDKITVDCNSCTCQSGRWACSQRVCHGTCTIYGSGHYITFDGKHYDFDGHCTYVAAQDYCGQNSSLGSFSIVTENVPCGTTGVTCSKAIKIFMGRTELKLEDKHRSVIQRDVGHHVAYTTREVGLYLVVETSTGIIVIWDKKTTIFIKLAPSYKGTVCGLCGNFDQRSSNDFTTRGHMVVDSELEFGNSWKEAPTCPDVTTTIEPCNLKPHRRAWAEKQCSIIKDEVFRVCHSKVDPKPFYDACVHDSCSCDSGGDCECFCSAVAAYAQQCTKEGACVFWRTPNLCPIFCDYYNPPDKCEWHYEPCGNRSFETCRTVHGIHSNISVSYLEGCYPRCPVDRPIYDEDLKQCVTRDQCGCYVEDTHYPPGVSVPPKHDCESCVCTNDSKVNCWPEEGKILNYTQNGAFCYWEYCGPNGTVEQHFNICVSTPTPISTPITTTPVTTTTTTTTTTPTPTPSTVSSPPSTTPKLCCFWSDWINNDHPSPSPDGGDRETFDSVCQAPEDIECRSATEPHLCWEELGQKVQCDVSSGFTCRNEDQFGSGPFPICYDYEIRVNCCLPMDVCPESTTSTPTPTATPTTSPTTTPTTTSPTTTPTTTTSPTTTPTTTTTTTEIPTTTPTTTSPTTTPTTTTTETPTPTPTTTTTEIPTTTPTTTSPTTTPTTTTTTTETPTTSPITPTPEPTTTVTTTTTTTTTETPTPPPTTITTTTETPTPTPTTTTTETPTPTPTTTTTETPTTTPTTTSPTTTPTTTTTSPTTTPTTTTSPTTPTTVTTRPPTPGSTPCEYCSWTGWNSTGKPNATSTGGDIESIKNFCHSGWAANISCRAAMFPDRPIEDLGQKVVCDLSVGLVCKNQDQKPGGPTFMPICLNYEINVYCCSYDCVTTTPVTPSTTPTISSTGTPTTTPHSTTPVPPTTTPTTTTTTTPEPTTTVTTTPTTTTTTTETPTPTPTTTITETPTPTPTTTSPITPTPEPTTTVTMMTPTTTSPTTTPTTTTTTTETPTTSPITPTPEPTTTVTTTTTTETPTPPPTTTTTTTETPTTTPTTTSPTTTPTTTTTETPTTTPTTTSPTTTPTTTTTTTETPTTSPITPTPEPTTTVTTTTTTTTTETPTPPPTTITTETPTPTPTTTTTETPTTTPTTTSPTTTPTTTTTTTETPTTSPITPTPEPTTTVTTTTTTTTTETPTPPPTTITITTETPTTSPITPTPEPTTTVMTTTTTTTTETPTPPPTTITTTTETPTPTPTTTTTETPTPTPTTTTTETPTTTPTTTSPTTTPTTTTTSPTTTPTTTTSPTTPTTVTTRPPTPGSTPCEYCSWTGWNSTGKPNATSTGGDIESIKNFCHSGWAANISCRAAMFPDRPIEDLGQKVVCDLSVGLVCKNQDQKPGGPTFMPICLNYEINVYCCSYDCVTTTPVTPSTTPTISSTGTPTTTPHSTTPVPPTPTPTISSTGTPTTTPVPPTTTPTTTSTGTPTTPVPPTTTTTTTSTGTPTTTPVLPTTTPTTTPTGTPTTTSTTTSTGTSTTTPTTTPTGTPTTTPTTTSTGTPTTTPTTTPTGTPTTTPTTTSTGTPTTTPTTTPTGTPTTKPTTTSTGTPTTTPTTTSTGTPTTTPTTTPTGTPTTTPTTTPTETPTTTPTTTSTGTPTTTPTTTPTGTPTTTPTTTPTGTPTTTPTTTSTTTSTGTPTTTPTTTPTGTPTTTPTTTSTGTPTTTPTTTPTGTPTTTPTTTPTGTPTTTPTTTSTTTSTGTPTTTPTTTPTGTPTTTPTTTSTGTPTTTPTTTPTGTPTTTPTTTPTGTPTTTPTTTSTTTSTGTPTTTPTTTPTGTPTTTPTTTPTGTPTTTPTTTPTGTPTTTPTTTSTGTPTTTPTTTPTGTPTTTPTTTSTGTPTTTPTTTPTGTPTTTSTTTSTGTPTTTPTTTPTGTPTTTPTTTSTGTPTTTPTTTPTGTPTTTSTTTSTGTPTTTPTTTPTGTPTTTPTTTPTGTPTTTPTTTSTGTPTTTPTTTPTGTPTTTPTTTSTGTPTTTPTTTPTGTPTTTPTTTPTGTPTTTPTTTSTTTSTGTPTTTPTTTPTGTPTTTPTTTPTGTPTTTPTTTPTGTPTTTPTTTSTGTPTTTPTTTPTGTPTTTSTTTPVPPTTTPTTTPTGTPTTTPVPPTTTSTTTSTGTPTTPHSTTPVPPTTTPTTTSTGTPTTPHSTTPVPPTTTPTTTSTGTPTTPHSTTPVPPTTTPTTTSTGTPTTPHSTTPVPPTTTPTTTSTGTPTTTPVSQSTSPSSTESTTPQTTSPTAVKTTETKPTVTTPGNTPPGTQTSGPTSSKTTPTSGTTTGPPSPSTEPPSTPTPTPGTVSTTTTGTPTPPGHPSTTTATSVPVPSLSTPSSTPSSVVKCCEVNGTYYQPGDVVYNGTHGNTCYFVNCSLSCTLEIFNWSCPATPSTPSTPTPTTPLSEPTTSTRSPTTPTTLSSTPTVSKPPGCPLDPPRQENETWWLCNCTMAICKHDNTVELVQVECKPPPMPTCSNNLKPVRVMDPDGCCWHWECDCYCTGWGDPHYVTFDGLYYSYQGNCTYVLVEEINPTVDNFGVYIDNYHCDVNDQVSCPRTLIVRHETQEVLIKTVHMAPMKVQVQINKQAVALPYRKYGLQVYESGINFVVDIPELGALISYNGLSFSIRLPYKQFGNNTKGQCGTCTNSTADDCVLPSGEVLSDCEVAADQWVVNDPSKPHCPHTSFTTRRPAITAPGGGPAPSKNCSSPLCELIKDSLFAQCHPLAPPEHYYQACVFDTCTVPNLGLECSSLQTYAALCAHEGICIDWRNHTHGACPMTCPPHKEYQACGPAEEPTCKSGSSQNSSLLVEGCFCPEGTMSYAPGFDVCVDVCGCVGPDNVPREFGEHFEFDCKDCVCLEGGSGIVCQPKKCSQEPPAKCEEDGTYLVTEVNPADTCCNITTCKCNASMCQGKPPQCPLGFDVKSEMKPGRCCPFYSCVPKGVCVVLNAEYQPGSPVFSSKCETCVCTNTTDPNTQLNQVSCSHVPCKETCDPGFGLVTVPGECCKKCEQTHCIINRPGGQNLILKPGDMKSDPTNNCTFFSCVKIHNQLISSVSNITCPDFDPSDCLPGSITFMPNGCCKKCILRNETKIPCSTVSETKEISDGSCTAHVTMNYCSGSCGTFAMYSAEAQALDHKCSCCKEERTSQREALLRCPDGSWRSHTYTHIESCQCQDTLCELPAQRQGPRRARRSGHPSLHLPGRD